jgi:ATP-dependent phosphoenolpyruvate carboxykinase
LTSLTLDLFISPKIIKKFCVSDANSRNHIPDYDKTKKYQQRMYQRLKENLPTALKNAKLLSRDMPIGARADIADLFSDGFNILII